MTLTKEELQIINWALFNVTREGPDDRYLGASAHDKTVVKITNLKVRKLSMKLWKKIMK